MKVRVPGKCASRLAFAEGPGILVAVDSGARKAGAAVYTWVQDPRRSVLLGCTTVSTRYDDDLPALVYTEALNYVPLLLTTRIYWAVERPQKYKRASKYHKDLDRLLKFITRFPAPWDGQFLPQEWKGNVGSTLRSTKAIHHRRALRALRPLELALTEGKGHDALDAVCLGLYVLGRTGRGGTQCPKKP